MFFDLKYKIGNDNDNGEGFIHGFNQEKGWLSNMGIERFDQTSQHGDQLLDSHEGLMGISPAK